jgi:hypothetical protein
VHSIDIIFFILVFKCIVDFYTSGRCSISLEFQFLLLWTSAPSYRLIFQYLRTLEIYQVHDRQDGQEIYCRIDYHGEDNVKYLIAFIFTEYSAQEEIVFKKSTKTMHKVKKGYGRNPSHHELVPF